MCRLVWAFPLHMCQLVALPMLSLYYMYIYIWFTLLITNRYLLNQFPITEISLCSCISLLITNRHLLSLWSAFVPVFLHLMYFADHQHTCSYISLKPLRSLLAPISCLPDNTFRQITSTQIVSACNIFMTGTLSNKCLYPFTPIPFWLTGRPSFNSVSFWCT